VSRLRWRIAHLADKLPGQCWADLADWAQRNRRGIPWQPVTRTCIGDVNNAACYCGKLRNPNNSTDEVA
jgi:hypothetical protein